MKHMNNSRSLDIALLLMRLAFGGLMIINHGWGKLQKLLDGPPIKFADPLGVGNPLSLQLAVLGEVICPILLVIGLFTRWAAIPALITMLVAAWIIHGGDPFKEQEKALMFAVAYLVLFLTGPGRYSIDTWWKNRQMV